MQDIRMWKDLLYKEVRSTLTATNSDAKIARHLN